MTIASELTTLSTAKQALKLALEQIGSINLTAVSASIDFSGLLSLVSADLLNVKRSPNLSNGALSAAALNALFESLPVVSGKTITVSRNPGAGSCTRSIATEKGWTVSG